MESIGGFYKIGEITACLCADWGQELMGITNRHRENTRWNKFLEQSRKGMGVNAQGEGWLS